MYRRAAAQGPLQGVAAGPFTGGRKIVDAGKLTRAAKHRLVEQIEDEKRKRDPKSNRLLREKKT